MGELDDRVKRDATKSNLHKQMLNNLPIVNELIEIRNDIFFSSCWDHGVLNKRQSEELLALLVKNKMLQVRPQVK